MIPKIKFLKIPKIKFTKIPLGKNIHFRKFYFRNQKNLGKLKIRKGMVKKKILGTEIFRKNGLGIYFLRKNGLGKMIGNR